ncbi:MAG: autoinducer binding domain-containing protein [Alphaproteobacteria bacterium]|nr:autoinducer binding domain-containing protein [Alphaproteobacteria bacterium]
MERKIITSLPFGLEQKLDLLTEKLRPYGISHIGHGMIIPDKIPTVYFSSKEWAKRYSEENLVGRDPVRECALKTDYRMIPWDALLLDNPKRMILEERKKAFEANTGILISLKTKQFHETFVLGNASKKMDISHLIFDNKATVFKYLLKFREHHLSFYKENNIFLQ